MRIVCWCITILIATLAALLPAVSHADGCYLCQGGGYVEFTGDDSFSKRREAKEKFACVVQGTTSSCQRPKGSVGALSGSRPLLSGSRTVTSAPQS